MPASKRDRGWAVVARVAARAAALCLMGALVVHFAAYNAYRAPRNVYEQLLNAAMDSGCVRGFGLERYGTIYLPFESLATVRYNPVRDMTLEDATFVEHVDGMEIFYWEVWGLASNEMHFRYVMADPDMRSKYPNCYIDLIALSLDDLVMRIRLNGSPHHRCLTMVYHRDRALLEIDEHGYDDRYLAADEALECFEETFLADYFANAGQRCGFSRERLGDFTVEPAVLDNEGYLTPTPYIDSLKFYIDRLDESQ